MKMNQYFLFFFNNNKINHLLFFFLKIFFSKNFVLEQIVKFSSLGGEYFSHYNCRGALHKFHPSNA